MRKQMIAAVVTVLGCMLFLLTAGFGFGVAAHQTWPGSFGLASQAHSIDERTLRCVESANNLSADPEMRYVTTFEVVGPEDFRLQAVGPAPLTCTVQQEYLFTLFEVAR